MLTKEQKKMSDTLLINHAGLVLEVEQQKDQNQLDAIIVRVEERLEQIKDSLLFNKHVLNVVVMGK